MREVHRREGQHHRSEAERDRRHQARAGRESVADGTDQQEEQDRRHDAGPEVQGPDGPVACVADLRNLLEQEPRGKGVEREARGLGSVVVASIPAHVAGLLAVRVDRRRPVRERADEREVRRGVPACRLLGPGVGERERERRPSTAVEPNTATRHVWRGRHAATRGAPSEGGRGSRTPTGRSGLGAPDEPRRGHAAVADRYQATVRSIPSREGVEASKPKSSRARVASTLRLGWPFGRVAVPRDPARSRSRPATSPARSRIEISFAAPEVHRLGAVVALGREHEPVDAVLDVRNSRVGEPSPQSTTSSSASTILWIRAGITCDVSRSKLSRGP